MKGSKWGIPGFVYIPFPEIGFVKGMYLIKRYVKKYPQPKFPVEKNQKCSECQKMQRKHKISFCFNTLLPLSCKSSKQISLLYCFGSRGEEGINYLLQINRKVSILGAQGM